jgi:hypothetical protein
MMTGTCCTALSTRIVTDETSLSLPSAFRLSPTAVNPDVLLADIEGEETVFPYWSIARDTYGLREVVALVNTKILGYRITVVAGPGAAVALIVA